MPPGLLFDVDGTLVDTSDLHALAWYRAAVESGGFSRHEVSEAGAIHVYRDVAEMLSQLRTGPVANLL